MREQIDKLRDPPEGEVLRRGLAWAGRGLAVARLAWHGLGWPRLAWTGHCLAVALAGLAWPAGSGCHGPAGQAGWPARWPSGNLLLVQLWKWWSKCVELLLGWTYLSGDLVLE